jgi:Tol biopolymer transport system component
VVVIAVIALVVSIAIIAAGGSPGSYTREVAFVTGVAGSTPQLWVAPQSGGAPHRLGAGRHPLLSPDGALLAASSATDSGSALLLYRVPGGAPHSFFSAESATATALAWSPDSRYLAVALASADPASSRDSALAVIDSSRMTARILANGVVSGASFAPDASDRIAYGLAAGPSLAAPVNVFVAAAAGAAPSTQLTRDGASLNPVWGPNGIAFDRQRLRKNADPAFQIWLVHPDGTRPVRLTNFAAGPLQSGLVPVSFSADGHWLLANATGLDTSQAWSIDVAGRHARLLALRGGMATAGAMARSTDQALVDVGGFLGGPSAGRVETVPLGGGPPRTIVTHGSEPTWTG